VRSTTRMPESGPFGRASTPVESSLSADAIVSPE
jgi:hypothetical protein